MYNFSPDKEVKDFKNKLKNRNIKGLVLDVDETLSWTFRYWVERMQIQFGNPENLSIIDIVQKYKYHRNVPYWQTDEAREWAEFAKNDNKTQENLPLITKSNSTVRKINQIIPIIRYLTARPRSVVSGTQKWLDKHSFPKANILARPTDMTTSQGNEWKAKVLEFLYPQILGIVDDNTSVVDNLSPNYKGVIYLYNNETTDNKSLNIIPCKTWPEVHKQIKLRQFS